MINSKDTKIIKDLVISALWTATRDSRKVFEIRPYVKEAFDVVIKEMEDGKI